MPAIELDESLCGLSLKMGCVVASVVYISYGSIFLTAEVVSPVYVDENPDVNEACHYLNLVNNGLSMLLGVLLLVAALVENKISLFICLIIWGIHILTRMVVALLITMHMGFFVGIHVIVGFVAIISVFLYFGLIIYSYYKKL
ncbi:uncharacterized protein LOC126285376 [Schistocerca gregaria]|uniref:uncharacterized protein LOC126285376 n=1 Tax=Schistocerca gregaria TaxID=7010 RepID=UPI00211E1A5F|nr:uncharacterized protein LOC126285376 [Schistocerca gregaria]